MARMTIREILHQPGFILGCVGLALCMCARDTHMFVLFDTVQGSASAQYLIAASRALPLLLAALVCGRAAHAGKPDGEVPTRLGGACAIAGAAFETLGLCIQVAFAQESADLAGLASLGIGHSLLVCAWMCWLVGMRQRVMFVSLITGFVAAGLIEALMALMDAAVMGYALLAVPALSLALFMAARHASGRGDADAEGMVREPAQTSAADAGKTGADADAAPTWRSSVLTMLTFFAYSFIARELSDTWMNGLAGEPLRAFQLLGALGTVCAGGLVFLAFSLRRSYKNPAMFTVFVTFVVCLALYLSLTLTGHLSALVLVPLFVLRKMLLFLPAYFARGFGRGYHAMRMFSLAMLFVELGNICQTAFFQTVALVPEDVDVAGTLAMLACMVYIVAVEWSQFFKVERFDEVEEPVANAVVDPMAQAVAHMSENCGLSARETEVLACLAAGRNAEYVARTLGIAPSTAKSHIAHIYRKTGFNSQQRLMDALMEGEGK